MTTPSPARRARPWVLLALAVALGAVWLRPWRSAPTIPPNPVAESAAATEPAPPPTGARPHLRLLSGAILRAEPRSDAAAVLVLEDDRLLPVRSWSGAWAEIDVGHPAATGWTLTKKGPDEVLWLRASPILPRPAVAADLELLTVAHRQLGEPRETHCGPYPLLTDVHDATLLAACDRLVGQLDDAYGARFGVTPLGEPRETLVLFATISDYQAFAAASGSPRLGYAGHSLPGDGLLALYAGSRAHDEVLSTLVHEIAHLQHRRALGGDLPRWLSEGLADALGDSATTEGLAPLAGLAGAEGQAHRLRLAYGEGRVGSVRRLLALAPEELDAAAVSYDYEQSAFLVRLLLTEPRWAAPFRAFLADFAGGRREDPEALRARLQTSWRELDEHLRRFVEGGA